MSRATTEHASRIEAALRSPVLDELTALLWKLRRGLAVESPPRELVRAACELGFLETNSASAESLRLTPIGARVSDSLTEYRYWKDRGKRHHWAEEVGALHAERLRGKRILEIGCGAGVNLLSLQQFADVVGIDAEPLYLEFAEALARVEGLPKPPVACAFAEQLPFGDATFDVAVFH